MTQSRAKPQCGSTPYWRRNRRLIILLFAAWAVLTAVPALYTRYLDFSFIGWPFPFWLAAYGAPLAYLAIVGVYAWAMNRADARAEREPAPEAGTTGQADPQPQPGRGR